VKWAEGSYTLSSGYTPGTPVSVSLSLFRAGTGNVSLSVSFDPGSGDDEITAAELSLYSNITDYQMGNPAYSSTRYRKPGGDYGAGTDFVGTSPEIIPIAFTGIPSGNYVVTVDFFRFKYVRVSRLMQTIIVRDGLTTGSWDGGGSTLNWGADKFASSNADLGGISIGGETITLSPGTYSYSVDKQTSAAPSDPSNNKTLTITAGTPGQTIRALLNGAPVTGSSLTGMEAANSLVITVTAPDGLTKQTYTVGYIYTYTHPSFPNGWTVTGTDNPSAGEFATVNNALNHGTYGVKTAYDASWPGKTSSDPIAARINISGTITEAVNITDTALYASLPALLLAGEGTDKIQAASSNRPLTMSYAAVILGDGLTLTGGNLSGNGGGIQLANSIFTMNGGTISSNTTSGHGGGMRMDNSTFTMNGGSVSGNTASGTGIGGGVYVAGGTFNMSGGTISENIVNNNGGGGVYVNAGSFTMNGGTINNNTASTVTGGSGGGVFLNGGSFTMSDGTIRNNTAERDGGGVLVHVGATFTMNGGSVSGNTAERPDGGGGGVFISGGGTFLMDGGAVSGNTATTGGGVYIFGGFNMSGGSVSGNSTSGNDSPGGGVYLGAGSFTMSGGSVSGNSTSGSGSSGAGVYLGAGSFTMSNGTISGNTAAYSGGGVWVENSNATFTMSGGIISGNTANSSNAGGGGVGIMSSSFTMTGGAISGNTANKGGGVLLYQYGITFTMSGGTITGNIANTGGGVCFGDPMYSNIKFEMQNGTIAGNTASTGGGVYVSNGSNTFTMSGASAVAAGNPVYLYSGRAITLSGTLTANPAANIVSGGGAGTQVLGDDSATPGNDITDDDNYKKFLLNGESNADESKIGSDGIIK
jgi:hypothetical protein